MEIINCLLSFGSLAPNFVGIACSTFLMIKDNDEKKAKENLEEFLKCLYNRKEVFEKQFRDEEYDKYKNNYINMVVDFVVKEKQKDKIKYLAKVVEYIVTAETIREDILLSYLDLVHELRCIDISVLFLFYDIDCELTKYNTDKEKKEFKEKRIDEYIKTIDKISFKYVENKLKAKGLVNDNSGGELSLEDADTITSLSEYGSTFINILTDSKKDKFV